MLFRMFWRTKTVSKQSITVCDNCKKQETRAITVSMYWFVLEVPDAARSGRIHLDLCSYACLMSSITKYFAKELGL